MAISFGHDRPWGGVSQREYRRMEQEPWHPLAYRVHFAALGWADPARGGQAVSDPLLSVRNLSIDYVGEKTDFHAVKDVSFAVTPGERSAIALTLR